jgi:hypothetical protein
MSVDVSSTIIVARCFTLITMTTDSIAITSAIQNITLNEIGLVTFQYY